MPAINYSIMHRARAPTIRPLRLLVDLTLNTTQDELKAITDTINHVTPYNHNVIIEAVEDFYTQLNVFNPPIHNAINWIKQQVETEYRYNHYHVMLYLLSLSDISPIELRLFYELQGYTTRIEEFTQGNEENNEPRVLFTPINNNRI